MVAGEGGERDRKWMLDLCPCRTRMERDSYLNKLLLNNNDIIMMIIYGEEKKRRELVRQQCEQFRRVS